MPANGPISTTGVSTAQPAKAQALPTAFRPLTPVPPRSNAVQGQTGQGGDVLQRPRVATQDLSFARVVLHSISRNVQAGVARRQCRSRRSAGAVCASRLRRGATGLAGPRRPALRPNAAAACPDSRPAPSPAWGASRAAWAALACERREAGARPAASLPSRQRRTARSSAATRAPGSPGAVRAALSGTRLPPGNRPARPRRSRPPGPCPHSLMPAAWPRAVQNSGAASRLTRMASSLAATAGRRSRLGAALAASARRLVVAGGRTRPGATG